MHLIILSAVWVYTYCIYLEYRHNFNCNVIWMVLVFNVFHMLLFLMQKRRQLTPFDRSIQRSDEER